MVESVYSDDTWEDFFGSSPELMPSIMGAFDAIIGTQKDNVDNDDSEESIFNGGGVRSSTPKRSHQSSNFANLSPCVQKILANVPEQEISKKFSSEETLGLSAHRRSIYRANYRSFRSPDKYLNRSNESLDIISSNVQKMLSNLPDTELVISASNLNLSKNSSYLHASRTEFLNRVLEQDGNCGGSGGKRVYHSDGVREEGDDDGRVVTGNGQWAVVDGGDREENSCDSYGQKPLGSYLHSSQGIASRMPAGRKNAGKFLQVPSESSVGNTSSTASSEVSRPVSLTSLGSCSSSGSSGHHQPGSVYLASAESLDSDPEPTGSQGSADSGIAEPEQPKSTSEQRVLQEVLETEAVYVADLEEVIEGYLEQWRRDPECPLAQHLTYLFNNLEEIYKFNRSFLEDLRKADCDPTKTANCFLLHDSGFSVYNEYCTNYPRTMEVLSRLTNDDQMAALFRERQLALGHALPLGSYLLKPVQRILKYHLLLQRLSKQCQPAHKATVDLALTTMTGIAADINTMKRKHEHAVRVQEIQSQLYGWPGRDLTALGELIAEGTFRVVGARGRRHVCLFEKVLLLAKSKQDGALAYKTHIMCSNLMLVEQVRGEPLSFQVLPFDNPRLQSTLKARSLQHKREWTLQIKRVILENYTSVIPNRVRQLVLQLGQDLNEKDAETTEKWSPLKPSSTTPHYLERRSRMRKTRDFSNRRASSQDRSFPSLGGWRRKSEPSMVPQYNSKTVPKKISKIKNKKQEQQTRNATFYTDLSDSETCDTVGESMENLAGGGAVEMKPEEEREVKADDPVKSNLEKIVSEILMQNQKMFGRSVTNRRTITSDPTTSVWFEEKVKLPTKADSLPRSFQLSDKLETDNGQVVECKNERLVHDMSLKEHSGVDGEQQDNDLSSQLDDNEHPEHKIYRKSAIRFSILQRIRHIMSEEQKRQKYSPHRQSSKSIGEKIAHPDYVDPHKLFLDSKINSSVEEDDKEDTDIMGEPELLDLSINEKEVLNEIEKRLNGNADVSDTGQDTAKDNMNGSTITSSNSEVCLNSSQISDSYYERILEDTLKEEYVKDSNGRLVAKQDSFSNPDQSKIVFTQKYKYFEEQCLSTSQKLPKRPSKAPPPIPAKPARLNPKNNESTSKPSENSINSTIHPLNDGVNEQKDEENTDDAIISPATTSSWVKAMVGRFE